MANYLKNRENGRIFPYSEVLAKKDKFIPCTEKGVATGSTVKPDEMTEALAKKDKIILGLQKELSDKNVYIMELEARVAAISGPRAERASELKAMARPDLLAIAKDVKIENAASKYRGGDEAKLIVAILDIEFPVIKE